MRAGRHPRQVRMTGRLIGIARRGARRAPMREIGDGQITLQGGLVGDFKGAKYPRRQITVLAREDWQAALAEIGHARTCPGRCGAPTCWWKAWNCPAPPEASCASAPVRLEVTAQTYPCARMEEAQAGLLSALARDWRGGVTCRVLDGGPIALGDPVEVTARPPRIERRLPG